VSGLVSVRRFSFALVGAGSGVARFARWLAGWVSPGAPSVPGLPAHLPLSPNLRVRPPGFEPGTCGLRVGGDPSSQSRHMMKVLVTYSVQSIQCQALRSNYADL
jgi:hypothetical protein